MADRFDEMAERIWQSPGGNKRLRHCIAKVLRDVERETAEECCKIAHGQHAWHDTLEEAIRERFGLDEKKD